MGEVVEVVAPFSVQAAVDLMATAKSDGRQVALAAYPNGFTPAPPRGGADLVVDLSRVPGIRGIRTEPDALVIGALTTYPDLLTSAEVLSTARAVALGAVAQARRSPHRHCTLGGALNPSGPPTDLHGPLVALDASVVVMSANGRRRTIPIATYLTRGARENCPKHLGDTCNSGSGLLLEVRIPRHDGCLASYERLDSALPDWGVVAVAVDLCTHLTLEGNRVNHARVAAVHSRGQVRRLPSIEQALIGCQVSADALRMCVLEAVTQPHDGDPADVHPPLQQALVRRALGAAVGEPGHR